MKQSDFLKVVLPFKDKVFRLAKRLLVSNEEAEDATQELLFKLWKNKEKIAFERDWLRKKTKLITFSQGH